ncbi:MAG: hypothetical protein KDJ44_20495 [Rhodoblastus sp.]|nr:hypothetical protein [Rhodoblastus sp.]
MKKLILHIGRHKTGTTSVQRFLAANADVLAARGVCYPMSGRGSDHPESNAADVDAHHRLAQIFTMGNTRDAEAIERLRQSFLTETHAFDTVIVSSEVFQNVERFHELRKFFEGFYIVAVGYLREYASYVASAYAQEIKTSARCEDVVAFERTFGLRLDQFLWMWNLVSNETRWRLYDPEFLKNRDVVADFLDVTGLDIAWTAAGSGENVSWSGNLLGFKRIANVCGLHPRIDRNALDTLAASDKRFSGPIRIAGEIQDAWRASNNCNNILRSLFGPIPLHDFSRAKEMFDWNTFEQETRTIIDAQAQDHLADMRIVMLTARARS